MLKRCMLRLLEKLLIRQERIHWGCGVRLSYSKDYRKRLSVIRKIPDVR